MDTKSLIFSLLAAALILYYLVEGCCTIRRQQRPKQRKEVVGQSNRSFSIDYPNNQFLKDGQPFSYISGSIHYFRIPSYYWRDRLLRLKAGGLNAIEVYVAWNVHEPTEGRFDFTGQNDVGKFIQTAADLDLAVILRGGPFICSEWDYGGLPWWLAKYPGIKPRSSDKTWLTLISKWFDVLLPKMQPYLYKNGGPIILVQIENEYGSHPTESCVSIEYKALLRDKFHAAFGYDTQLITVDGGALQWLKCGTIPAVFPTIDFGPADPSVVEDKFHALRLYAPRGPLVNSEFYPGWLDEWGSTWSNFTTISQIISTMRSFHSMNASYNMYMFHGGSNFGFSASAYVTQSYDYSAPLSESGAYTSKYWAIRNFIRYGRSSSVRLPFWQLKMDMDKTPGRVQMYRTGYGQSLGSKANKQHIRIPTPPPQNPVVGGIHLPMRRSSGSNVIDVMRYQDSPGTKSKYPMTMEDLNHPFGFVLYETTIPQSGNSLRLDVPGIRDRAKVFVDRTLVGSLASSKIGNQPATTSLTIKADQGSKLQIFVEHMGRSTLGLSLDLKGIISNVTLDDRILDSWTHFVDHFPDPFPVLRSSSSPDQGHHRTGGESVGFIPAVYMGEMANPLKSDTFFNPNGWGKGQLYINNHNIGRYWPSMGPQVTLYVPKGVWNTNTADGGTNTVLMVEIEQAGNCNPKNQSVCAISFIDHPILNKPIPNALTKRPLTFKRENLADNNM